jgi:hypothetical protein
MTFEKSVFYVSRSFDFNEYQQKALETDRSDSMKNISFLFHTFCQFFLSDFKKNNLPISHWICHSCNLPISRNGLFTGKSTARRVNGEKSNRKTLGFTNSILYTRYKAMKRFFWQPKSKFNVAVKKLNNSLQTTLQTTAMQTQKLCFPKPQS